VIDILDTAAVEADKTPISKRPKVRLAQAGLSINDVAEERQVERFRTCVTTPFGTHGKDPYCRARDIQIYLNRWKLDAGQPA
jgi:hypothetical protein